MPTIAKAVFEEIQKEIGAISSEVKKEASAHPVLSAKADIPKEFILATLMLFSGKMGKYNIEKLVPTGVALELLEYAVEEHYPVQDAAKAAAKEKKKPEQKEEDFSANLSLITGDFYYSRAIMLVAGLKDVFVIRVLAEAIASIAEAITFPPEADAKSKDLPALYIDWIKKITSLYDAACYLGGYLSGAEEATVNTLRSFGKNLGGILYVAQYLEGKVDPAVKDAVNGYFFNEVKTSLEAIAAMGFDVAEIPGLGQ